MLWIWESKFYESGRIIRKEGFMRGWYIEKLKCIIYIYGCVKEINWINKRVENVVLKFYVVGSFYIYLILWKWDFDIIKYNL